ncbi:MAG TPA: DUF1326 domain-containing protein [Candidatus Dormibacteraeota bacterium]|jgi:hypothetical protein|nr:DUF1326 domain-containing protein [Candidatus Dormibacteraeota bacterium]
MHRQVFGAFAALFCAFGILGAQKADQQTVQDFEIEGVGLFQCQCAAHACPCQTNGAPTHGTCFAADVAHIKSGHYGEVRLDGLSIALVGDLVDARPERLFATLYLDRKASPEQREALRKMMEYMNEDYVAAPGEPAVPFRKISPVPFEFSESADKTIYSVVLPGILEEKAILKRSADGKPVSTITAMDSWSNVVHNADNVSFRYHDQSVGKEWDESGDYANVKYFHLTKMMYDRKQMLGQHGDMSGAWTLEQKEIIRKQGLKEK